MFATLTRTATSHARTRCAVFGPAAGGSTGRFIVRSFASLEVESSDYSDRVEHTDDTHFLLILGKPGGGKGTISGKVLKDMPNFHHLSSGDVLRHHVREGTEVGNEAKKYMNEGKLVPDEVMVRLIMEDAHRFVDEGKSLLLDGFPRTLEQAAALDKALDVDLVINLDIPTETIVDSLIAGSTPRQDEFTATLTNRPRLRARMILPVRISFSEMTTSPIASDNGWLSTTRLLLPLWTFTKRRVF